MPKPPWLDRFEQCWQNLTAQELSGLDTVYHEQVSFEDPSGKIDGRYALKAHLAGLYSAATNVEYHLGEALIQDQNNVVQPWQLSFQHPRLNGGNAVQVEGVSILRANQDKIIYHRDYFDMGQLIYESIPLLGGVIKHIKHRVSPS